jgi:ankyrin repeat protein
VETGDIDIARCLVNELGADVNKADEQGSTPLYIALQLGNLEMMRCLVKELGADARRVRKAGNSLLNVAAQKGHLAVMRCLVKELGTDVDQEDNLGCSPFQIAAQEVNVIFLPHMGSHSVASLSPYLSPYLSPWTSRLVEELGADANKTNVLGWSPLFSASWIGHLEVMQCLVELGANINRAATDGSTLLMMAAGHMHHKIVRYLLKHGANPQALHESLGTAADISKGMRAPGEQTAYLQARTHCANPSCTNAGLKKCERCLQVYFCGSACIRAHWSAHKVECKAAACNLKAARGTSSSSSSSSS